MSICVPPKDILKNVAEALVARHRYSSVDEALWALALSAVKDRVEYYQRRIRKLERKYSTDFNSFTARLRETAHPAEEDDWLAWRSAASMLADWKQTYRDMLDERPR